MRTGVARRALELGQAPPASQPAPDCGRATGGLKWIRLTFASVSLSESHRPNPAPADLACAQQVGSRWQFDHHFTTSSVRAIGDGQIAIVSFDDLPTQDQSQTGSVLLGGIERHEEVVRVADPAALIGDFDEQAPISHDPIDRDYAR